MPLVPRSLKWRTILLTLLGLIAVGVSAWWTFRADISAFVKRQQTLHKMRNSKSFVDRKLARGEPRVGTPVDEWAAIHPPKYRFKHDEYETLMYDGNVRRTDLTVIAVNGRIVYAGTGPWRGDAYSGDLSPTEEQAYYASRARHSLELVHGHAAVLGVPLAGSFDPTRFPTPLIEEPTEQP